MNTELPSRAERDPYPMMIIVVIAITLLLFLLVAGVMAYDFIARGHTPSASPKSALTDDGPPIPAETAAQEVPSSGP